MDNSSGAMAGFNVLGNMANSMWNDQMLARDEKRRYNANIREMQAQNLLLRRNSKEAASDYVTGLKLAGLNPALAHAGNFSPAQPSQGSLGSGGAETPPVDVASLMTASSNAKVANAQADNLKAQNALIREQAKNVKADTHNKYLDSWNKDASYRGIFADSTSKEIDAKRKAESDAQARRNLLRLADEIISNYGEYDDSAVDFAYSLMRNKHLISTGTLDGLNAFVNFRRNYSSADKELAQNAFDRAVADLKNSQGVASQIYDMDVKNRDFLLRNVEKVATEIAKLEADTELSKEQKNKVVEDAKRASADAERIISSDVSGNFSRGDYKRAFIELLVRFLDAFVEASAKRK